jgi:hypothetical protein
MSINFEKRKLRHTRDKIAWSDFVAGMTRKWGSSGTGANFSLDPDTERRQTIATVRKSGHDRYQLLVVHVLLK